MNEIFRPDTNKFFVMDTTEHIVKGFSTYKQADNFRHMNNPMWIVVRNPLSRF